MLIVIAAFLPYIHDAIPKGLKGYFGFSSFRVMVWTISIFIFGITGWFYAFVNAKGRLYRFALLVPIFMATYQLLIYIFDARKSEFNTLNAKLIVTFVLIAIVLLNYFMLKRRGYGRKVT